MSLKSRVLAQEALTGLWQGLPGAVVAEIAGSAGFDFLVLDGEHGPWDPSDLRLRLIASSTECVIRVPDNQPWIIKQALDLGVMTLLVPMVNTAEEAAAAVAASRYPPDGIRGLGATAARAARFGRDTGYVARANDDVSIWVQVESQDALRNLEAICAVPGVDLVFVGPADLAADMGYATDLRNPEVLAAVEDAMGRIRAAGKSCGAFGTPDVMEAWRSAGANVLSAGADGKTLADALAALAP